MTRNALTDTAAMQAIQQVLSGQEWTSDTPYEVAQIMRGAGYEIADLAGAERLIIEVCPIEPRASACLMNGAEVSSDSEIAEALADCRASGDNAEACKYVLESIGVEFRIVARNAAGEYENRLATDAEMEATARAIYFESDTDFSDRDTAAMYLVWDAAHHAEADGE